MYIYTYIYTYIHIYICTYTYSYIYINMGMGIHIYIYLYVCICVYIHTQTHVTSMRACCCRTIFSVSCSATSKHAHKSTRIFILKNSNLAPCQVELLEIHLAPKPTT